MGKRFILFWSRIKRWINTFPTSLLLGFLLGIIFAVILQKWNVFIAGVLLGVVIEQLLLGIRTTVAHWMDTHPIRRLLGTIAADEVCYIYFSSYLRDLSRPSEFKLTRWTGEKSQGEELIEGPAFVLGEGDALALASIRQLLARIKKKQDQIKVERAERYIDKWGEGCFCIGAHNHKTRVVLSKFNNPYFVFDDNYGVITSPDPSARVTGQDGKPYRLGVYIEESHDSEPTDYGILLKLTDQFHSSRKTVFVVAGIGPAGTSGAAYYLLKNYEELSQLGDQFGVLVQVPSGYQSARQVEFHEVARYYVPLEE